MPDLLDTNFLSELRKPRPEPLVVAYFLSRPAEDLFISTVTLAEIRFGIQSQMDEIKRDALANWLEREIRPMFAGRALPVTEAVMLRWRVLLEQGRKIRARILTTRPNHRRNCHRARPDISNSQHEGFSGIPDLVSFNPWEPLI